MIFEWKTLGWGKVEHVAEVPKSKNCKLIYKPGNFKTPRKRILAKKS